MAHRRVSGLLWASRSPSPFVTKPRASGAKAHGLRYERALARLLPMAEHGSWFRFQDSNGLGFCQPDLLAEHDGTLVVLEAKYTWVLEGHSQISDLYLPVVGRALGRRAVGLVVCKNLVPGMPKAVEVFGEFGAALRHALHGGTACWHWIGGPAGALVSRTRRASPPPPTPDFLSL